MPAMCSKWRRFIRPTYAWEMKTCSDQGGATVQFASMSVNVHTQPGVVILTCSKPLGCRGMVQYLQYLQYPRILLCGYTVFLQTSHL
jgi:hypothetical protein